MTFLLLRMCLTDYTSVVKISPAVRRRRSLRRLTLRGSPGMTPRRAPVYLLQVYLLFLGIETDVPPSARGTFSPSPARGRRAGWTGRSYRPFWTAGGPSSVTGVGSPGRCRHSSLVLVPSHRNLSNSVAVFRRPAFLGWYRPGEGRSVCEPA